MASITANQLIDQALRRELDRELAFMARGEDMGANRRRKQMLGQYLLAQPAKVIRRFYSVRMQMLTAQQPGSDSNRFYSDIVHQQEERGERTFVEQHTESVRRTAPGQGTVSSADMDRIALQVAERVEKRMKLNRERSGRW